MSLKILLIDNEAQRQRNLRTILASLGYKSGDVESIEDGQNALSLLKKKVFNCIIIFNEMQKTSGIEILKDIRSNSRLKGIPVIIYSADVSKDVIASAVQAGANGFLGYPFSASDVESALRQATSGKK
jgi:two-component system chemotaxis response regulator CheY